MPRDPRRHAPGDGSEPLRARSDLRLRRRLSLVFAPAFAVGAVLLALRALRATPGSEPSPTVYGVLAALCMVLMTVAIADLYVIERRTRAGRRGRG
ncbi:DUF6343 family protein [Streptomyces sp. NBC_00249]|uniref:DUF6343 family protein n=1 Tax=Streptomyces sp. NBC_00249 TaxID=2975690 RepID=UPI00225558EE|nr:DUF6343 family protein [Streptomyces sp. NBC_00249]MCX5195424.1 DUF6343 family protein [Streptomyces sp. NBC_00249]